VFVLVLGGPRWTLRDRCVAGALKKHLVDADAMHGDGSRDVLAKAN
jgi:hypothetical protein